MARIAHNFDKQLFAIATLGRTIAFALLAAGIQNIFDLGVDEIS